jgi:sRNA-binding protein
MSEEKKQSFDVRPVLDRLAQFHPQLFGARFLPLKLGIFEDLMAAHPDAFTKQELKAALGVHARSTRYLEAVASGAMRHDLEGKPAGDVAPEHVHHAIMEIFRRRQQRAKADLRPWVVEQLVRAIDASKLDRDAYMERIGPKHDEALALLDEAFAQIGARNAKHEAVRRAWQASGKSVEEFAEMYGMRPADVRAAVQP